MLKKLCATGATLCLLSMLLLNVAGCPGLFPGNPGGGGPGHHPGGQGGGPAADGGGMDDGADVDDGGADDGGAADDGAGDDGGAAAGLTIVKTNIAVRHDAGLECGDDVIAFGTDTLSGVSYIIPSAGDTTAREIPNSAEYDSGAFACSGDTIWLVGGVTGSIPFQMAVFDVPSAAVVKTFDPNEIRLAAIEDPGEPGNPQADGDYCAVICDQTFVADGKILKVIDVSGGAPALITFDDDPADYAGMVDQVAVCAATHTVVAVADDSFWVYDLDDPAAAPTEIAAPNGIGDVQIRMYGDYIIALDDQAYPQVFIVDLSDNSIHTMANAEGVWEVGIGDGVFAFFADTDASDSSGGHQRAAVGSLSSYSFTKAALDDYIDGATTNNGLVGFAASLCVVPDGSYVFLADWYLQYSAGNAAFTVPADPDGSDPYGCPAWDVDCSNDCVGFKTAADRSSDTDTTLGYIVLP